MSNDLRHDGAWSDEVGAIYRESRCVLTDAEREAIEWCVEMALMHATECEEEISTLRGLLERTK